MGFSGLRIDEGKNAQETLEQAHYFFHDAQDFTYFCSDKSGLILKEELDWAELFLWSI